MQAKIDQDQSLHLINKQYTYIIKNRTTASILL